MMVVMVVVMVLEAVLAPMPATLLALAVLLAQFVDGCRFRCVLQPVVVLAAAPPRLQLFLCQNRALRQPVVPAERIFAANAPVRAGALFIVVRVV